MKILLADDHALFRDGLRLVLAGVDSEISVVEATDYPEALTVAGSEKNLDLALVDLSMPGMERFTGLSALCDRLDEVPVVVVSANESNEDVRRAMGCGASGYIPKALDSEVIRVALERVLSGGTYLPPSMVGWEKEDPPARVPPPPRLTPRQRDVLGYIARGYSNKKIASELKLAEGTVKLHVAALLKALGVNNRTEAVFAATAQGLVESPSPGAPQSRI
ncbi:MAG: response regulator transcription factor [Rhodospirillales bacterium]|nr:response regulator transcription factor [Alphaproteobacteria bacterium]MBL6947596.1 response regulator transcription factor [Rhodospirillales bacterium]